MRKVGKAPRLTLAWRSEARLLLASLAGKAGRLTYRKIDNEDEDDWVGTIRKKGLNCLEPGAQTRVKVQKTAIGDFIPMGSVWIWRCDYIKDRS